MTSRKSKRATDEKILMQVLSAFGVSKIDFPKLIEVTGITGPVVIEALRELISRGLVADGHDDFTRFYYLTEKGDKLVRSI